MVKYRGIRNLESVFHKNILDIMPQEMVFVDFVCIHALRELVVIQNWQRVRNNLNALKSIGNCGFDFSLN